ncbi:MAG: hypothetical protein JXB50_12085 [Spirochaetes bacterium]|nr:hypothetical protein [Spirochaetota bacterium]
MKNKIKLLEDKLNNFELINENIALKNQINIANSTITSQNIFLTSVAVLIAFFTILSGVIIYTSSIKPAREATKELNDLIENTFKKSLIKEMDLEIDKLLINNNQINLNAIMYISQNHLKFITEEQINKIYNIIITNKNPNLNASLVNILSKHKYKCTEDFFCDNIWPYKIESIAFFTTFGIENYLERIKNYFKLKDKDNLFPNFLTSLFGFSNDDFLKLINYKPLIDIIASKYESTLKHYIENQHKEWIETLKDNFTNSELYKQIYKK